MGAGGSVIHRPFSKDHHWRYWDETGKHHILLNHSAVTGIRVIQIDGKIVLDQQKIIDDGSHHTFRIGCHTINIHIDNAPSLGFIYTCQVDHLNVVDYQKKLEHHSRFFKFHDSEGGSIHCTVIELSQLYLLINDQPIDSTCDFIEGGSQLHFTVGPNHTLCTLTVYPAEGAESKRRTRMEMRVEDRLVMEE